MDDPGVIEIARDGGAGFRVRLIPPDPKWPDEWFDDIRRARGSAGGLRLVTGRRKLDLVVDD